MILLSKKESIWNWNCCKNKYENETANNSSIETDEDSTINETSTTFKKKNTIISLAKYNLIFSLYTWDRNDIPVKCCAAKDALSTIDSKWLAKIQL